MYMCLTSQNRFYLEAPGVDISIMHTRLDIDELRGKSLNRKKFYLFPRNGKLFSGTEKRDISKLKTWQKSFN